MEPTLDRSPEIAARPRRSWAILPDLLLVLIVMVAAALRLVGTNWDESQHLHPDERFLTMVETDIRLPDSLWQYFDTATSPLNPHNAGHGFFVYGTLPIFSVRLLAEWTGNTGYDQVTLLGRTTSAVFDLISVVLIYLIGSRLYRRRVGLLAAAFAACTVLFIQHAHFLVVEAFVNTFILAGIYFAVRIQQEGRWRDFLLYGLALGMATASKISAAPLAGVIALVSLVRWLEVDEDGRKAETSRLLGQLVVAALVALLAFRIFQPYAFAGPSFFGFRLDPRWPRWWADLADFFVVRLNPQWLANMRELVNQSGGNVDIPPALQWADRTPVLFALKNMVVWGMGLPLGITAWLAWGWAVVRMIRRDWRRHLIPVVWTGTYFLWQSTSFTPAMRYQLPVYPTLILLAAWALWEVWDRAAAVRSRWRAPARVTAGLLGSAVLLGTAAWALAFVQIYMRPMPRVAATRWIYTHLPGVVNLVVDSSEGDLLEPILMPLDFTLTAGAPHLASFVCQLDGSARAVLLPHVLDLTPELGPKTIMVRVMETPDPASVMGTATFQGDLPTSGEIRLEVPFEQPVTLSPGRTYYVQVELAEDAAVSLQGNIDLAVVTASGDQTQGVDLPRESFALAAGVVFETRFSSHLDGRVTAILLPHVAEMSSLSGPRTLTATVLEDQDSGPVPLGTATFSGDLAAAGEQQLQVPVAASFEIHAGADYTLRLELGPAGALGMRGSVIISESTWDDGLPLRIGGRDMGGLYTGVVQELYWADDQDDDRDGVSDKLERLMSTLAEGDILAITSNRQYGTIPRVPIRYPLTTAFYRALLGCPAPEDIARCADRARPGEVHGELGYDLVAVFDSNPTLFGLELSDQPAEEMFTVYDHPQVLIFARNDDFSAERVAEILGQVDLSHVVHILPGEAGAPPKDLLLPPDQLAEQRAGGTWSDLFSAGNLLNRSQVLAVVAWWLLIALVGLAAFPLTRAALPGLADGGYPLARVVGLVVVAWGSWLLGSLRVPFGRLTILGVLLGMAAVSAVLAWRDRRELAEFIRLHRREILLVEALAAGFFLLDLAIRLGNPDLWHPSKGGEKPMDLSYLIAVLKSTSFPPYDPWFAGGTLNYYYYGFVIVAIPIKLLGLNPTVAYNLAIPTLFSLLALAAYSAGSNLVARWKSLPAGASAPHSAVRMAGLAAALSIVVLGNLGTVRMIYEGLKRLGTPQGEETAVFIPGVIQAARGTARFLTLESPLPYALDSWYWNPSRAIPPGEGEVGPITEFPFFTFLYADLHAHMISRPLAVLCLAWMISWLLAADERKRRRWPQVALGFLVGGLALGALRPTNLGDYPVYWGLAAVAAGAAVFIRERRLTIRTLVEAGGSAILIVVLAYVLYLPYYQWYGQGYGAVELWHGGRTPLSAYLTVHGLFLFVILSWMAWETGQWMAETPVSALAKLKPAARAIGAGALLLVAAVALLTSRGYAIAPLAIPVVVWAGVLLLRPGLPLEKRVVLVLVGTAVALTFLVEVVVIRGDISRMNTVFKFYLQVWEMFGLASAAALVWMVSAAQSWRPNWRQAWTVVLGALVVSAALYPLVATVAKVRDRWYTEAPYTLDGMAFMPYATYFDFGGPLPLAEDYRAIRWMQSEVEGSPVIVEANIPEYKWGSRFTIYTGLPGVLGWNWHQRQQRVTAGDQVVWERANDITSFYLTPSVDEAQEFLDRYQVQYVIVGQLERMYYGELSPCLPDADGTGVSCDLAGRLAADGCGGWCSFDIPVTECTPLDPQATEVRLSCPADGLEKFDRMVDEGLLRLAYQDGGTVIYEVVR